jgi:hypothetical protein
VNGMDERECAGCMSENVTETDCDCVRTGTHVHLACEECGYRWTENEKETS